MPHRYRVTVEEVTDPPAAPGAERSLRFEPVNHDDLLEIVERVRSLRVVPDGEAAEFAIGLKLFGEIAIRYRKDPLFSEFWPHFGGFMKCLKGGIVKDPERRPALQGVRGQPVDRPCHRA